jgi:transcriptional regulator with XRE-family HTH domain
LEVSIGTKLKALRLQAGMTQVQLAQACGVIQSVLTRYENDLKTPSAPRLAAIAKALGVTVEDILDDAPLLPTPEPKLHVHGNSRAAKVQELFLQLDEETQRVVLKQIKALVKPQADKESARRPRRAA